jgi:hypothetical protein
LFLAEFVGVQTGPAPTVPEREEVPLEPLVAQLAGVEEVIPFIRQPVIARAFEVVFLPLLIACLRPEVLDVPVAGVGEKGLAERAFGMLGCAEGVLDRRGSVDRVVKIEGFDAALVIVGCGLEGVAQLPRRLRPRLSRTAGAAGLTTGIIGKAAALAGGGPGLCGSLPAP